MKSSPVLSCMEGYASGSKYEKTKVHGQYGLWSAHAEGYTHLAKRGLTARNVRKEQHSARAGQRRTLKCGIIASDYVGYALPFYGHSDHMKVIFIINKSVKS